MSEPGGGTNAAPTRACGRAVVSSSKYSAALAVSLALFALLVATRGEAAPLPVYGDALQSGFVDWSWGTHNLSQSATVHTGSAAISFEPDGWAGLYLHRDAGIDVSQYGALELWVRGAGAGGQKLTVAFLSSGAIAGSATFDSFVAGGKVPAGSWAKASVPFSALGVTSGFLDGVWLQDASGVDQPTLFVDEVQLLDQTTPPPPPAA